MAARREHIFLYQSGNPQTRINLGEALAKAMVELPVR